MGIKNKKAYSRLKIKRRIRKTVVGTADRPRMSVFRSNKQIYVQLIDDSTGSVVVSASSQTGDGKDAKINKINQAKLVGTAIAEKAKGAGVETVVFDRNGYLYHGRIKSLADAAREGGLKF
ncbi:MAG: 50S ribosomal protein L18 [Bacteroidales bacterium]|jgi:large subunit ribosomal protein L18|nr:50S ribosomal protein L18 [Lentimicrobiaceae bacterium]MDG1135888.1 50S ribosomal protein L18 [Bacteroidales bacterium]MDG1902097.1 50S ribosomal protein L18 [Bacteroidales bacterium]MDG2080486.1 50S ribosomal protein L18 [Bacteroidales bacterium]|tara:strand:- start:5313 stop:5675 length:363 start_codon:yes stop_codon:yes gene_type:complete